MRSDEYRRLDGTAIADLVRRREVTAGEVAEAADAVIAEENPRLGAVVRRVNPDLAGVPAGPMAGVPFLLKDIGAQCAGLPTTAGNRWLSRVLKPAVADDELVRRFRRAGLVIMGQTSTPDLGMNVATEPVLFGPTRNPLDPNRSPGGSSGGAAAAVASGMVPIAHATDGAGSIRIPAACCGLVGLKPSRGAVPEGPRASHVYQGMVSSFVITRTVRDAAAVLAAVHGADAGAPYAAPALDLPADLPAPLRVAIDATVPADVTLEPGVTEALTDTARRLAAMGHVVEQASLPLGEDDLLFTRTVYGAQVRVQTAVLIEGVATATGERPIRDEFEPVLWAALEEGQRMTAADLVRIEWRMHALTRELAPFFDAWDVLLTPATAGPAWPLGALPTDHDEVDLHVRRMLSNAPFTALWNITGQPALVIPSGRDVGGLPVGVQLVTKLGGEGVLLALGTALTVPG